MSNIFDALKKKEGGAPEKPAPSGPFPVQPVGKTAASPVRESDFHLLREMHSLSERILSELPRGGRRVIAFTGAAAGEGATTVALHLARVLARDPEGRILLVDADMARVSKSLTQSSGASAQAPGLVEVLAGEVELSKAVLATDVENLHFLPSGVDLARGKEAILSDRMRDFVDDMGQIYRMVILDCAPLLSHSESRILAAFTDGAVLVVRSGRTRREVVQKALALLQAANVRVLGVVLNQRRYPIPDFIYRHL